MEFLIKPNWIIVALKMSSAQFQRLLQDCLEKRRRQDSRLYLSGIQRKIVGWRYNLSVMWIQPTIDSIGV